MNIVIEKSVFMKFIKKRARQLMIEGSKHNKKHNRSMKVMLYLIFPFGFFFMFIYLSNRN